MKDLCFEGIPTPNTAQSFRSSDIISPPERTGIFTNGKSSRQSHAKLMHTHPQHRPILPILGYYISPRADGNFYKREKFTQLRKAWAKSPIK